jgi:hypothetical protein
MRYYVLTATAEQRPTIVVYFRSHPLARLFPLGFCY